MSARSKLDSTPLQRLSKLFDFFNTEKRQRQSAEESEAMGSISLDKEVNGPPTERDSYQIEEYPLGEARSLKVICIGAGATGLNLVYRARRHLKNIDLTVYEKNSSIGGTWFENVYPGCACDIPSHIYQFLWALNPDWSSFYVTGPEILKYFTEVAERYQLHQNIKTQHVVTRAEWCEEDGIWNVTVIDQTTGQEIQDSCHFLVNGAGFLNHWQWPDIPGLQSFKGTLLHSAHWDQSIDLSGKRIAVIGNGSSGIQLVTALQPLAEHLTNFIRNPTWISTSYAQAFAGPNGANFSYSEQQKEEFRKDPAKFLQYRKAIETDMNSNFAFSLKDSPQQALAVDGITKMMKARLGSRSEDLSDILIPTEFGFGCRRPTPGTGYLEALTAPNVTVEYDSIGEVVENGIRLKNGTVLEFDAVICATGFETSWRPRFPIIGRDGTDLRKQWKDRPKSYLSCTVANFPNYFVFLGPNSPLSHGSALPSIEHLTKYLFQLIYKVQTQNYKAVEPLEEAVDDFIEHADKFMERTVWAGKCRSWMKGGKKDSPPLTHPGSRLHWFQMLQEPRWEDYKWTRRSRNRFAYLGNGWCTMDEEGKDKAWYMDDPDQGFERLIY
ncbi:hypothetical protein AYO21_10319 [Fonsecaea monophora]|uniref:FAD/NAD(P)-binding domain-containing protein n=1 Tax=Fonsecaea monophora TaxID=254056 RepID=A0A177EVT4_9EURO|nr:hypothetical protein AYO21_10319 [Fonsecaea monophora]KAH0835158.1 putative sterigmatocystin biosynthesis monooxygenase stcW [Fonsecaea pedrosoi]OAG35511.1 hypothetical protein AYO21_10319 [Fonsecaea monophora]